MSAAMISIRPSNSRGHLNHGWLDTYHSFSFGSYHNPERMGFRALRVLNEDVVQPGQGFGTHPHQDMEIVTVILAGSLEHRDSTGGGSTIRPGIVQHMSAGTGIQHSEFNPSSTEPVHLLQVWLQPSRRGLEPSYGERAFGWRSAQSRLVSVASPDGRDGSLVLHSPATLFMASLGAGRVLSHSIPEGKHIYVHVATGTLELTDDQGQVHRLEAGAAAALSGENTLRLAAESESELLVFELD